MNSRHPLEALIISITPVSYDLTVLISKYLCLCREKNCKFAHIQCFTCTDWICSAGFSQQCPCCYLETCRNCAYQCPVSSCDFEGCLPCTKNHFWEHHLSQVQSWDGAKTGLSRKRRRKHFEPFRFFEDLFMDLHADNSLTN